MRSNRLKEWHFKCHRKTKDGVVFKCSYSPLDTDEIKLWLEVLTDTMHFINYIMYKSGFQ